MKNDSLPDKYYDHIYKIIHNIPLDNKNVIKIEVEEQDVTYYLYTRYNPEQYIFIHPSNPLQLNTNKKLIFLVHGWTGSRHTTWYNDLKNALLKTDDVYVIQIDYAIPASQNYVSAVLSVPDVGK